jgi:hypothetical protein
MPTDAPQAGPDAPLPFADPELRELRIGRILSETFRVCGRNVGVLIALGGLAYVPAMLVAFLVPEHTEGLKLFSQIYGAAANAFVTAAVTEGAGKALAGRPMQVTESLQAGLKNMAPALGVAILAWLGSLLGLILLVIPGVLLWLSWVVAVPVVVTEHLTGSDALTRSSELTRGYRGPILGLVLLSGLCLIVVLLLWGILLFLVTPAEGPLRAALSEGCVGLILAPYAVVSAVLYHRLRELKEAPDAGEMAEVFR